MTSVLNETLWNGGLGSLLSAADAVMSLRFRRNSPRSALQKLASTVTHTMDKSWQAILESTL
jgi:hypothetical protein